MWVSGGITINVSEECANAFISVEAADGIRDIEYVVRLKTLRIERLCWLLNGIGYRSCLAAKVPYSMAS